MLVPLAQLTSAPVVNWLRFRGRARGSWGVKGLAHAGSGFGSEVEIVSEESNGLQFDSAARCQHNRSVLVDRVESVRGNVGVVALSEIR